MEGHNFDIRKHVLKYDEVVNEQRETIYMQRRRLLTEPSLKPAIQELITDEIDAVVQQHTANRFEEEWKPEELLLTLRTVFPFPQNFDPTQWQELGADAIGEQAAAIAHQTYDQKEEEIDADMLRDAERQIMLRAVDHRWVRHLTDLDRLREGIGLQAIAQVDPLVAYKREILCDVSGVDERHPRRYCDDGYEFAGAEGADAAGTDCAQYPDKSAGHIATAKTVRNTNNRPKRNDPCWCGSGKKYKICHMKTDAKQGGAPVARGGVASWPGRAAPGSRSWLHNGG